MLESQVYDWNYGNYGNSPLTWENVHCLFQDVGYVSPLQISGICERGLMWGKLRLSHRCLLSQSVSF